MLFDIAKFLKVATSKQVGSGQPIGVDEAQLFVRFRLTKIPL